jgi:5,10-methylenetetrahydromethanopterin reductase
LLPSIAPPNTCRRVFDYELMTSDDVRVAPVADAWVDPLDGDLDVLGELGFYALAGHTDSPRDLIGEVRQGEQIGLGSAFISERFNFKDAPTLCGAAAAISERIGIATAATNHNTRHPLITATFGATMHRLSGGRFSLGLGRGFDRLFLGMGLPPIRTDQLRDTADILRQLWGGGTVTAHSGPAGNFPHLHLDSTFTESIPLILVALGERTLEFAGACMDGVVLHTFMGEEALRRSVASVRRGAERIGRDPAEVRIWSVLATVGDHIDEAERLKKTVGRLASYLRGYGDLLVKVNGWDPSVLERFRADPFVAGFQGAMDARATTAELDYVSTLLPDEWLAIAATGTPSQCAGTIVEQFALGADSVILHGATPAELLPVIAAYRAVRPAEVRNLPVNPGKSRV